MLNKDAMCFQTIMITSIMDLKYQMKVDYTERIYLLFA